jgi:transposase InsO family protein
MPKSTGGRYTEEFKAEAVQLARSSPERSIRQLAYELGIADQTLRNWIKQAEIDRGEREALQQAAPDLIGRNFASEEPDRLWVADITYVRSTEGFVYLAFILDACSRKVVGWSMATHLRTELVVDALQMAIARRKPSPGLVHHSDRGVQYTSLCPSARDWRMRDWCRRWAGWARPTTMPSLSLSSLPSRRSFSTGATGLPGR